MLGDTEHEPRALPSVPRGHRDGRKVGWRAKGNGETGTTKAWSVAPIAKGTGPLRVDVTLALGSGREF
jgi:hypothetical protein